MNKIYIERVYIIVGWIYDIMSFTTTNEVYVVVRRHLTRQFYCWFLFFFPFCKLFLILLNINYYILLFNVSWFPPWKKMIYGDTQQVIINKWHVDDFKQFKWHRTIEYLPMKFYKMHLNSFSKEIKLNKI